MGKNFVHEVIARDDDVTIHLLSYFYYIFYYLRASRNYCILLTQQIFGKFIIINLKQPRAAWNYNTLVAIRLVLKNIDIPKIADFELKILMIPKIREEIMWFVYTSKPLKLKIILPSFFVLVYMPQILKREWHKNTSPAPMSSREECFRKNVLFFYLNFIFLFLFVYKVSGIL